MLVGPKPDEPGLAGFAEYLRCRAIPHAVCCDLTRLRFGLFIDAGGDVRARLHLQGWGTFTGDDVEVFVRAPWALSTGRRTRRSARFAAQEYYSSLWSLCALLPKVINRPGQWAWPNDGELKRLLPASSSLPEFWTTDPAQLASRWDAIGSAEVHGEDLLTSRRTVSKREEIATWKSRAPSTNLRALFAPSSRYVIHVCVGRRFSTVLNEPDYDVESAQHRALLRAIARNSEARGVRFFALALVVDERRRAFVTRITADPPFSWYREHADTVHRQLHAELQRPFPADPRARRR